MAPMRNEAARGENISRAERQIEQILGVGLVRQLRVLTEGIIGSVDDNVKSAREAFDELRATLKVLYPKRKFLNMPPEIPK